MLRLAILTVLLLPSAASAQPADGDRAARDAFEHAHSFHDFDSFTLGGDRARTFDTYVRQLAASLDDAERRARIAVGRYSAVLAFGRSRWTLAALVEQGRIYETLARVIRERRTPPQFSSRDGEVAERLQPYVDRAECFAIARYVLAVRAARAGRIDVQESRAAVQALRAYDEARIAACVDGARHDDPTFEPYRPGELE